MGPPAPAFSRMRRASAPSASAPAALADLSEPEFIGRRRSFSTSLMTAPTMPYRGPPRQSGGGGPTGRGIELFGRNLLEGEADVDAARLLHELRQQVPDDRDDEHNDDDIARDSASRLLQ